MPSTLFDKPSIHGIREAIDVITNILETSTRYSIIGMDTESTILLWNEGAHRVYGYEPDEIIGCKNADVLFTPEDIAADTPREILHSAMQTGKWEGMLHRVRKNGEIFAAHVVVIALRDEHSTESGYLLISKDISNELQLREELDIQYMRVQEANRHRRELLANMSHELRTPLNGIIGFSDLLHEECIGPVTHEQKEYLGDILSSSRHLLQLINNILDLTTVEAGKMSFVPEAVDIQKLVSEVCASMRPLAASKHIHIKTRISTQILQRHIVIDASKFKQVLSNYLSNAIKFTPNGGHVTITILPEEPDRFRVEIKDDGPGIQPENIHLLFVDFQQLDTGTMKKYQGLGLGLALNKRIVEAQGGSVGVQSVPGTGSTFFATFPYITTNGSSIASDLRR